MNVSDIIKQLKDHSDPEAVNGMARFGINPATAWGISLPILRSIGKSTGRNHSLAEQLWITGIHEARILAGIIDNPREVTEQQMEDWTGDFNSWDICDQCCMNLFRKTPFAWDKAVEWSRRNPEFVKRAGFALMATLAVHDKKAGNEQFLSFFRAVKRQSTDKRNFVKKAVTWALRQIGKRNLILNKQAVEAARDIRRINSKSARWIASNAIKELTDPRVIERLKIK